MCAAVSLWRTGDEACNRLEAAAPQHLHWLNDEKPPHHRQPRPAASKHHQQSHGASLLNDAHREPLQCLLGAKVHGNARNKQRANDPDAHRVAVRAHGHAQRIWHHVTSVELCKGRSAFGGRARTTMLCTCFLCSETARRNASAPVASLLRGCRAGVVSLALPFSGVRRGSPSIGGRSGREESVEAMSLSLSRSARTRRRKPSRSRISTSKMAPPASAPTVFYLISYLTVL